MRRQKAHFILVIISVLGFLQMAAGAMSGEAQNSDALQAPRDLTGLSIEELLEMEITPINVLGSHTHLKGEWMIGYRYMFMNMQGNLEGTRDVSDAEVLQSYRVVHTEMTMEMHMVELMYAPSDDLTLMAMVPYRFMSMDHLMRDGMTFRTESDGIGDLNLMALYNVLGSPRRRGDRLVLNGGLSLPTGSIDAEGGMPGRSPTRLEYSMQLGSGTVDLMPGVTYLGESENWAWGAQAIGTIRLGKNDNGYRLGDGYRLSGWGYYKVTDWFGPSLRLDWHDWENVHGADPQMDPTANPAFDAGKQEGERLDVLLGVNFYLPRSKLKGVRLAVEGGVPAYQSLAGPNMKTDWLLSVGLSYAF